MRISDCPKVTQWRSRDICWSTSGIQIYWASHTRDKCSLVDFYCIWGPESSSFQYCRPATPLLIQMSFNYAIKTHYSFNSACILYSPCNWFEGSSLFCIRCLNLFQFHLCGEMSTFSLGTYNYCDYPPMSFHSDFYNIGEELGVKTTWQHVTDQHVGRKEFCWIIQQMEASVYFNDI